MTLRPTVFDLGGRAFAGDLPPLPQPAERLGGPPGPLGGSLLLDRPHVTLRNGTLRLRPDQELRLAAPGAAVRATP